jgi:hypothetical protein
MLSCVPERCFLKKKEQRIALAIKAQKPTTATSG